MVRKRAVPVLLLLLLAALIACGRRGDPYPRRSGTSPSLRPAAFASDHG